MRKIPPAVRYAYYRSGLSITDCRILESSADALLTLLGTFGQIRDYSVEQVVAILWGLYRDFLVNLSIFRMARFSVPVCAERILSGWLEGMRIDAIADLPDVALVKLSRSDVTRFIDEFCTALLPWALNGVRGYIAVIALNPIAEDQWLTAWSAMIRFGLPTPKSAIFYALGLRSREASICCAEHCEELAESSKLARWMAELGDDTVQIWQLADHIQQEIIAFRDNLRISLKPIHSQELW